MIDLTPHREYHRQLDARIRQLLDRAWSLVPNAWECPICNAGGCATCHDLGIVPLYIGRQLRSDLGGIQSKIHGEPLRLEAADVEPQAYLAMRQLYQHPTLPDGFTDAHTLADQLNCHPAALYDAKANPDRTVLGHTIEHRPATAVDRRLIPLHALTVDVYRATPIEPPAELATAIGAWWRLTALADHLGEGRATIAKTAADGRAYYGHALVRRDATAAELADDGRARSMYALVPPGQAPPGSNTPVTPKPPGRPDRGQPVNGDWWRCVDLAAHLGVSQACLSSAAIAGHATGDPPKAVERRKVTDADGVTDGRVVYLYRAVEPHDPWDHLDPSSPITDTWAPADLVAESIGVGVSFIRSKGREYELGEHRHVYVQARYTLERRDADETEQRQAPGILTHLYRLTELTEDTPIGQWFPMRILSELTGLDGELIRTAHKRNCRARRWYVSRRPATRYWGHGTEYEYRLTTHNPNEGNEP